MSSKPRSLWGIAVGIALRLVSPGGAVADAVYQELKPEIGDLLTEAFKRKKGSLEKLLRALEEDEDQADALQTAVSGVIAQPGASESLRVDIYHALLSQFVAASINLGRDVVVEGAIDGTDAITLIEVNAKVASADRWAKESVGKGEPHLIPFGVRISVERDAGLLSYADRADDLNGYIVENGATPTLSDPDTVSQITSRHVHYEIERQLVDPEGLAAMLNGLSRVLDREGDDLRSVVSLLVGGGP